MDEPVLEIQLYTVKHFKDSEAGYDIVRMALKSRLQATMTDRQI